MARPKRNPKNNHPGTPGKTSNDLKNAVADAVIAGGRVTIAAHNRGVRSACGWNKSKSPAPTATCGLCCLPNAERLTYTVKMGDITVVEPSALRLVVDGFDLPSGVVLGNVETYEIDETYPWHGATARRSTNAAALGSRSRTT